MSWIWGNETTDQAQIVVSALQSELDQREDKIKALEKSLRREQNELETLLEGEIRELEARRARIQAELDEISTLIDEKQDLLRKAAAARKKKIKKPKNKKEANEQENGGPSPRRTSTPKNEAGAVVASNDEGEAKPKAKSPKKKNSTPKAKKTEPAEAEESKPKTLPMCKNLAKVHKVDPNVAFIIQRSNNSNTVVYAGKLDSTGKQLDSAKPIDVYWIMYEKNGNPREELTLLERNSAYGVAVAPSAIADQYIVALASLKDRECLLFLDDDGIVQARTVIDGKPNMILRRVFVQNTTSWGMPVVEYVEIFGVDPKSHAEVYEKKLYKK